MVSFIPFYRGFYPCSSQENYFPVSKTNILRVMLHTLSLLYTYLHTLKWLLKPPLNFGLIFIR
jgi:hypothetical protein